MSNTTTAAGSTEPFRFVALTAHGTHASFFGAPDHVITRDTSSGLDYTLAGERGGELTHDDALVACAAVEIAGGGWRAPTRAELLAIVDLTRHDPAVDTNAFPFVDSDWYWSSDRTAWSASAAWVVSFYGGLVFNSHRGGGYGGLALAVRRAGQ